MKQCLSSVSVLSLFCFLFFSMSQALASPTLGGTADQEQASVVSLKKSDSAAEKRLLGRHMFSLQWISWKKFGTATVSRNEEGRLLIDARQALNGDEVTLTGQLSTIDAQTFVVDGELRTKVSHINGGNVCARSGSFTFKATGKRKYWRLQEMENPCDGVVDYVDIYF